MADKTNWIPFATHDAIRGWFYHALDNLDKDKYSKLVEYLIYVFGRDDRGDEGYSRIRSLLDFFETLFTKVAEKIADYLGEEHSEPRSIGDIDFKVVMEEHKTTKKMVARYLLNICGRTFNLHSPLDGHSLWKMNDVPPDGRFTMDIIILDFQSGREIAISPWRHRNGGNRAGGPNANGGRGAASSSTSGGRGASGAGRGRGNTPGGRGSRGNTPGGRGSGGNAPGGRGSRCAAAAPPAVADAEEEIPKRRGVPRRRDERDVKITSPFKVE